MFFKSKVYEWNELFLLGCMVYVVDLDDEYVDIDIFIIFICSKVDCFIMEVQIILIINDIVISKFIQIFLYLRQGICNKKFKKKDKGKLEEKKFFEVDMNIFEDIGDYVFFIIKIFWDKEWERYWEWECDWERDRDCD